MTWEISVDFPIMGRKVYAVDSVDELDLIFTAMICNGYWPEIRRIL